MQKTAEKRDFEYFRKKFGTVFEEIHESYVESEISGKEIFKLLTILKSWRNDSKDMYCQQEGLFKKIWNFLKRKSL